VSCTGVCDGTVAIVAIGGANPIVYRWLHDNSSSQMLTGLCAGTYYCNMTDANGCIRTVSVVIGATTSLTITPQITQSSCSASTGSITVNVTGATGPYTYAWLPAGNTATVTNLAPGSYTLTVSDGNCSLTEIYSVGSINGPVITHTQKDISCSVICDGSIALTITGGTPGYTPLWSNGLTTSTVTNLCAGSYSVQVTDGAGCKDIQNFSLNTATPIIFSTPDVNNVSCNNNCNGSITSIPTGGSLPYTFSWTPAAPSAPTTNSLCTGNYSITVIDANGCSALETYTIISSAPLTFTAVVTDASCSTVADGAVDISVAGGNPGYTYSWSPNGVITEDLATILSGTYSISITDNSGCKIDSTILVNATIVVNAIAGNDTSYCVNGPLILNGSNSIGGITYQWLELPLSTIISNTTIVSVPSVIGTNTYVLVATNGSCIDKDSIIVTVNTLPVVDAGPFVSIPMLSTTPIGGSPTSPTGVTYAWSPTGTLDNPSGTNPTTSTTITTNFTVTVTDANGCLNSDTVTVFIYPEVVIPNGFSPNGDGKNDVWQIDLIYQFPDCEVEIYNRWGEKLFYSKGYAIPFNGQYKGKDLPVGTYYYIINLNHPTHPDAYTSPLTIFR
jgi:gliding motility-associated-like protein